MKRSRILAYLGAIALLSAVAMFTGCNQGNTPGTPPGTTITSMSQIPAGTWVYSTDMDMEGTTATMTLSLVSTASSSATLNTSLDLTDVVTYYATANGVSASLIWSSEDFRTSIAENLTGTITWSTVSPYTASTTQTYTDANFAGATVTLTSTTLTVVTTGTNATTMTFTKQ